MNQEAFDRLVKICGLLSSDQDGERANAAFIATKILKEHKLSWADIVVNPQLSGIRQPANGSPWQTGTVHRPEVPAGYVAIDVVVRHSTQKAWLVRTASKKEGWVPKSLCQIHRLGAAYILHCPVWIAERAGFAT